MLQKHTRYLSADELRLHNNNFMHDLFYLFASVTDVLHFLSLAQAFSCMNTGVVKDIL